MGIKLVIRDEVNIKLEGLPLEARKKLANSFKYEIPYARYHPAFKLGRWDGMVSLFGLGGNGYLSQLEQILEILAKMKIHVDEVEDLRTTNKIEFTPVTETYWADQGKVWPKGHVDEGKPVMLRDYQVEAINLFLTNTQSLQEIATGAGKTITTATLSQLAEKYGRTITIVPNKSLVEQTEEDFVNVGLDVGVYYGDRKDLNKTHTICTWQSLNILDKKSKNHEQDIVSLAEFLDGVNTVIVDEVHMAKAEVLKNLLTQNLCNAAIRWGLTGTVPKEKFEYEQIFASLGPVVGGIKAHELQERGVLSDCHVNVVQLIDLPEFHGYADEYKYLVTDEDRMIYISKLIKTISETGNTLVLVNRIDTGKFIVNELEEAVFVSGAVKTKDRKEEYDEIKTSDNKIIVATYGVAAVGLNIPRIFNLVMIESGKSFTRVIQSIGRGIRKAEDKDFVQIWDITSTCKYAKRHLTERKKFYKDAKYPFTIQKTDWQK
ncbi:SSL2 DNA or RNA helicases of superfamily II [uncultured Caudovirales phage]|uniref:SSL2 DNA or RNA helicases of superfamily II n=1 Tax=uncultured Caudovirales phage TaxID=2100421 RepID=A0A6J5KWV0_9CAUD|nr:SSL2 DNA or RNA helicases of superfamily II [uncultured Caudovirales phage]CAB5209301.1 SSL2 DNA or RNA helicases of superfamily II [uncultured Caudovirales phage]